ncbi:MAG TPA: flagellar hook-basal body complex protein FliE [Clostridia bacterium]|nr:flagellar hook-basal body complex protein FliE [Clostridia bacterium]
MSPLGSINPALPVYGLRQPGGIAAPDMSPGIQGPLPSELAIPGGAAQPVGDSFASMLGRMVDEVNAKQAVASDAVNALQSGQDISLHQAVIAMEEANVSFQLMTEVRNKLLESYQELMRMQI